MQVDQSWKLLNFFVEKESENLLSFPFFLRERPETLPNSYVPYQSYPAEIGRDKSLNLSEMTIKKYCDNFEDVITKYKRMNYTDKSVVNLYYLNNNKKAISKILSILNEKADCSTFNELYKNSLFHHFLTIQNITELLLETEINSEIDLLFWNPEESVKVFNEIKALTQIQENTTFIEYLNQEIKKYIEKGKPYEEWIFQFHPKVEIKLNSEYSSCHKYFNPYQIKLINKGNRFEPIIKRYYTNRIFSRLPIQSQFPSCHQELHDFINEQLILPLISLLHISPKTLLYFFSLINDNDINNKIIDVNLINHSAISIESSLFSRILKETIINFFMNNTIDIENPIAKVCVGDDLRYQKYRTEINRGNLFSVCSANQTQYHYNIYLFSFYRNFNQNDFNYPVNIHKEYYHRFEPDNIKNLKKIIQSIREEKDENLIYLFSFFSNRIKNIIKYINFSLYEEGKMLDRLEYELMRMICLELNRICNNINFCSAKIYSDPFNGMSDNTWEQYHERITTFSAKNGKYGKELRNWWDEICDGNYFSIRKILKRYE